MTSGLAMVPLYDVRLGQGCSVWRQAWSGFHCMTLELARVPIYDVMLGLGSTV